MINRQTLYTILAFTPLLALAHNCYADRVTNERELAILPEYCRGTQGITQISKLTKPEIDSYYRTYGETYAHLHHYCWALMSEFNANRIGEKGPRNNKLSQALGDIQYVLNKNPPATFQPLAEIYSSRARILFKLGRPGEAVADLIKATSIQPGYQRAYIQLSDYYLQIGQKDKAISMLEKGVENNASPTLLLKRLDRLGKPYKGTPGNAVAKTQGADSPPIVQDSSAVIQPPDAPAPTQTSTSGENAPTNPSTTGSTQDGKHSEPVAPGNSANPYCRFCP